MHTGRCLLVFCILSTLNASLKAQAPSFQGNWQVRSASFNGLAMSEEMLKERRIVFTKDSFTAYSGDKKGRTIRFKLDPNANPKQIDLIRSKANQKALGIYALKGDELRLCYGEPGASRPKDFKPGEGKRAYSMILQRIKP